MYVAHNMHMNAQWSTCNKHMYDHIQNTKQHMLYTCKDICWVNENLCANMRMEIFCLWRVNVEVCDFICNFVFFYAIRSYLLKIRSYYICDSHVAFMFSICSKMLLNKKRSYYICEAYMKDILTYSMQHIYLHMFSIY